MPRNKKIKKRIYKARIIFLMFASVFSLLFVGVFRVYAIKSSSGDEFEQSAILNQINKVQDKTINPNRGSIFDRNNQALAVSLTVYNVIFDIRIISEEYDEPKLNKMLNKISSLLNIDINTLNGYFVKDSSKKLLPENDTHWKIIAKKVPFDIGKSLETLNFLGVHIEKDTMRSYPHDNLASQVIGFVRGDTMWGLEAMYDDEMTGTLGRVYRTYENTGYVETTNIEPIKGNDIITTLDLTLQQYAEQITKDAYNNLAPEHTPKNVSIILMDPNTGEILTMAQYPNFNLNDPKSISLLEDPSYNENFNKLALDKQLNITNSIWKNSAISDVFEPGSTFKAPLVAAALEEGAINTSDTFYCEGYRIIAGYRIRCNYRPGHGKISLVDALAKSCNLAMIDIGNKLGRSAFHKYQQDFGFGYKTGIDLFGEVDASSLVLDESQLNVTELATSSFGQTFAATPMQIITSFAATINGGNLMKPYLVSQIVDENGEIVLENSPEIIRKVISPQTSDFLRNSLVSTLEKGGTGYRAHIDGYKIGGKTGTSQQGIRSENIHTVTFAVYLPADDPEYLVLSTIQTPDNYSDAPTGLISPSPMTKAFLEKLIEYKSIPPSNPNLDTINVVSENAIILNDYTNKNLKTTIDDLNRLGLDFQIIGSKGDTVVRQIPPYNTNFDKNGKILLYIETINEDTEFVVVPDVTNLSVDDAEALLFDTGFKVETTSFVPIDDANDKNEKDKTIIEEGSTESDDTIEQNIKKIVVEQSPISGIFIEKGTTIKIKINNIPQENN